MRLPSLVRSILYARFYEIPALIVAFYNLGLLQISSQIAHNFAVATFQQHFGKILQPKVFSAWRSKPN